MKLGGIYISVGAKTAKLKRDLAKAEGMTKKTAVLMKQEIGRISFAKVGVAAVAFAATYAYGMKKAIDAASDLQEVQGKFDVVFTKHKKQAEDMAKILVDSYAMSTREAKQYMSSIQDLLVPMGMAANKALGMSHEVVKLSADLASFNNLPTAQVMLDIQSALVGNFETMKKYGVILNEHVVKEKAFEMGLYSGKGMVDANTKALVAYTLMVEDSTAAIGDQQRTMGSYANQMKQLKAHVENIAAAVGDKLLPEITAWVNQLNVMIETNPQVIEQIGEFAKNMLDLATAMGKVIGFAAEFTNVWVTTWRAMGLASTGIITWTEALTDATAAVERFNKLQAGPKFYKIIRPEIDKPKDSDSDPEIVYKQTKEMKAIYAKYYAALEEMEEHAYIEEINRERERLGELENYHADRQSIWESYNEIYQILLIGETEFKRQQYIKDLDIYLAVEQAKTGATDQEIEKRKALILSAYDKKDETDNYIDKLAEAASYYKDLTGFEETYYEKTLELIEARRIAEIDAKKDVAAADAKAFKSQMEALEEFIDAKQKGAKTAISAANDMLDASMDFVDKESSAYEAMYEARKVLQIAELAMEAYKNAQIIIGYFTRSAAAVTTAGVQNAANTSTAITGAAASVAAQGAVPIAGFGLAAAMLAFMTSVLAMAGIAFGGGSSGASAAPVLPKSTVLGADPGTGSESVQNTYELLKDNHAEEYNALRDIYNEIQDLNQNITGLVTSIIKGVGGEGFGTINTQVEQWLGKAELIFGKLFDWTPLAFLGDLFGGFLGSITGWVGSFLGGIVGSIFGGGGYVNVTAAGIEFDKIDFGAIMEGADVFAKAFAKIHKHTEGGWFHSDKDEYWTEYKDLDEDVIRLLTQIFRNIGDSFVSLAEGLGVDTQAVYDYILPIMQLDLKGMSAEEIDKAVMDFFSNITDTMAEDLFGDIIKKHQEVGEELYETAIRLVMQKEIILEALKMTGSAFEGTAQEAVDFSQALIEIAGDFETLMDVFTAYHDAFFTDAEKQTQLYEKLTEAFGDLGLELPGTKQGFRALIEGLDLTTESGMETYVALLKLAEASGIYYDTLEDNIKTIIDAQRKLLGTTETGALQDIADRYGLQVKYMTEKWAQEIIDGFTGMSTDEVIAMAESLGVSVDTLVSDIMFLSKYFDLLGNSLREMGRDIRAMLSDISSSFGAPDTAAMLMTQIIDLQSIPMAKQTGENLLSMSEKLISWYSAAVAEEQERVRLLNEENRLLEQVVDNVANLVDQIDQVIKSIKYSTLNVSLPYQKAKDATEDYWKLYSAAKTGGTEDIQKYIGFVQTYLQQQQAEHKSSQAYQDAYAMVMGEGGHLKEIQGMLEAGSYDQKIYDELKNTHKDIEVDLTAIQATFLEFEGWILNALKTLEDIQMILTINWGEFEGNAAEVMSMLLELVKVYGWDNVIVLEWISNMEAWAAQDVEKAIQIMDQIADKSGGWKTEATITFIASLSANLVNLTDAQAVLDHLVAKTGWDGNAVITFLQNINMSIFDDIDALMAAIGYIGAGAGWASEALMTFLLRLSDRGDVSWVDLKQTMINYGATDAEVIKALKILYLNSQAEGWSWEQFKERWALIGMTDSWATKYLKTIFDNTGAAGLQYWSQFVLGFKMGGIDDETAEKILATVYQAVDGQPGIALWSDFKAAMIAVGVDDTTWKWLQGWYNDYSGSFPTWEKLSSALTAAGINDTTLKQIQGLYTSGDMTWTELEDLLAATGTPDEVIRQIKSSVVGTVEVELTQMDFWSTNVALLVGIFENTWRMAEQLGSDYADWNNLTQFFKGGWPASWSKYFSSAGLGTISGSGTLPVSFADGGISTGPEAGYSATLHGTELVVSPTSSYPVTLNASSNQQNTERPIDINLTVELDGKPLDIKIKSISSREADNIRVQANKTKGNETRRLYR